MFEFVESLHSIGQSISSMLNTKIKRLKFVDFQRLIIELKMFIRNDRLTDKSVYILVHLNIFKIKPHSWEAVLFLSDVFFHENFMNSEGGEETRKTFFIRVRERSEASYRELRPRTVFTIKRII